MSRYLSKFQRRKIIAWDGEGANLESGEHVYNLLSSSKGIYILNHQGISTDEVFQFLLSQSDHEAINVIFGGSYDVNMWLRDVPEESIRRLWADGRCYWNNYSIHYAHRKRFSLYEYAPGTRAKAKRSFVLWDVLGYYQSSFVKACRKWLGEEFAGQLTVFTEIEAMKDRRSTFSSTQIDEIVRYNYMECQLLVLLVEALFKAMETADIQLQRYDGAGSIAAALLRKNNIGSHKGTTPDDVQEWSQYAYSGGWIEAAMLGNYESGIVHRYDVNSAYPSAALHLPSYAGAEWTLDSEWNGASYSMVEVEFHYRHAAPFYPLFYRNADGSILHPQEGRGRYYGFEIALLYEYFREGRDFEIVQAYNVHLALEGVRPFRFLRSEYATRLKFQDEGNMANVALKLGMNSVYGKLAQQAGYRGGRVPTYHHLIWAGQITSYNRAVLYRAAIQHPTTVIAFATDAVISLAEHQLPCGRGLGEWTYERYTGITMVQAGVYWLRLPDSWSDKYRGFDAGSLKREQIIEAWRNDEHYYTAHLTRFLGMGSAIGMNTFENYWRVWRTEDRQLHIWPNGKRAIGTSLDFANQLCKTDPIVNVYGNVLSQPYPLAWGLNPKGIRPTDTDGIDLRTWEEEVLDSYA